jgi:O-antigen/teichoic acid export membrane protein
MLKRIQQFVKERSHTEHAVMKNSIWLSVAEIGSRAMRGVLAIVAARMLGASGLGEFSYAIALGGFLTFFEDAGIGMFVTREFTKNSESKEKLFSTALALKLLLLGIAIILFLGIGPFIISIPEARGLLPVIALVIISDSLREFFFSITRAQQKIHVESKIKLATNLLVVAGGLGFMFAAPTALSLAWGYAVGGVLGLLAIIITLRKHLSNLRTHFSKSLFWYIFKTAWPFTILAISNVIIFNTDTLFIAHYSSANEVGYYGAASRLVQMFYILPALFATVTFPVFVQKTLMLDGLRSALRKSLILMSLMMIPLVLVMTVGAPLIVRILFGIEYMPASLILTVLAFSYIPMFIGSTLNNAIFALNQQKSFVIANILGMILNIILNFILVPSLHGMGAAVATVTSLSLITCITAIKMRSARSPS